jgi:hypothetical protein
MGVCLNLVLKSLCPDKTLSLNSCGTNDYITIALLRLKLTHWYYKAKLLPHANTSSDAIQNLFNVK